MNAHDLLFPFTPLDVVAVLALLLTWQGIGWRIENPSPEHLSTSKIVARYRHEWMVQMVTRQPRIFDATILSTLRQGPSFFASATLIAISGGLALLGNTDRLSGVAADLAQAAAPAQVWEVRILLVIGLLTHAFLSFVWSHRLFGYCAVVMASVPNEPEDPRALPRAAQAAEVNIAATRSFNRGLRSIYFALAAVAWFVGPGALLVATGITFVVLWRREFASRSRQVLSEGAP